MDEGVSTHSIIYGERGDQVNGRLLLENGRNEYLIMTMLEVKIELQQRKIDELQNRNSILEE